VPIVPNLYRLSHRDRYEVKNSETGKTTDAENVFVPFLGGKSSLNTPKRFSFAIIQIDLLQTDLWIFDKFFRVTCSARNSHIANSCFDQI